MKSSQLLTTLFLLALLPAFDAQVNQATCLTPASDALSCLECRSHYHLYEGLCFVDILGCEEYVYGNICRKCSNGYILVNNECCDRTCMSKAYMQLQNSIENQLDQEQAIKKAEMEGYEKSVSVLAKNSIKIGQNYEIISTKSQYFADIYRYQVKIDIQGKTYIGLLDYNVQTKQSTLVDLSLEDEPIQPQISLNEENIHSNTIYESGYKYIYMKFGLQLYELDFSRMTALQYDRSTELKFVFVGATKAVLITIVVTTGETYTLWKEEKANVAEIKEYVTSLKQIQTLSKEQNFQTVLQQSLTEKSLNRSQVQIVNITAISKQEYEFVIYIITFRIRYIIRASVNSKTKQVNIKKMEEVFHPKLQEIKIPQKPDTKIIEKASVASNPEAKEVFDYLYKVRPSFRQTQVDAVKIETGTDIKTITIMQTKDSKEYRMVVMKDQKTNELQLVDESPVVAAKPTTTIMQPLNDGTTSVTTNNIDYSLPSTKAIITTLKQNKIDTTTAQISSISTIEGQHSIQYTLILSDLAGTPTKQATIIQDKQTNQTTLTDVTSIDSQPNYIKPVTDPVISIPASQFYKPEIKDLLTIIQHNSEESITITKVKKITVVNTTLASKYELTVENPKGEEITISAIQDKGDQSVEVISIKPVKTTEEAVSNVDITNTKTVNNYGVTVEYTNDKAALSTDQNINVAVNYIHTQLPSFQDFEVISSLTKTYTQNQVQTIILSNGQEQVQVTGNIDIKTLRYIPIEHKTIPLSISYPVVEQKTIPLLIYPTFVKDHKEVKDSESILIEKYKIFKGKVPTTTTVEQYQEIIKTTFNYEIGNKKFIAIIDYNTTSKSGKVLEMSPVLDNVEAVSIQTKQVNGQTITTSNSVGAVQSSNPNTQAVIATITTKYPLIQKYNISQVKVIKNRITDTFEVTYTDQISELTTVITVISDKEGKSITINDINSQGTNLNSFTQSNPVVMSQGDYGSDGIKDVTKFVESKVGPIGKIISISSEISPSFIAYRIQAIVNDQEYEIIIAKQGEDLQLITARTATPISSSESINIQRVDTNGNTIQETNNATLIQSSPNVQTSIQQIIKNSPQLDNYDIKYVQTIDYGTLQQLSITFEDTSNVNTFIQSVVFLNKTDKTVNVASVNPIQRPTEQTDSAPLPYTPITFVPGFAVPNAIKSDNGLKDVITNIQKTHTEFASSTTVSAEVQTISENVTKYTVILQSNGDQAQAVYLYDIPSKKTTPLFISAVPSNVTAYYLTTTTTQEGTIIKSNNVEQLSIEHPDLQNILEYSTTQKILPANPQITSVSLAPSDQSATYTLEVTEQNHKKTVVISRDSSTKTIKLIDSNILPLQTVYPQPEVKIPIDVSTNKPTVDSFTKIVESSPLPQLQDLKEITSISKQSSQGYEKYYLQVINTQNVKYFVTLGGETGQKPEVIDTVPQVQTIVPETGTTVQQTDSQGNTILETSKPSQISNDLESQISIQEIFEQNITLKSYKVIKMKKINYGKMKEMHFVFIGEDPTQAPVQSIAFYNATDGTTDVASVKAVPQQSTEQADSAPLPDNPVTFVPGFAVPNAEQSDNGLKNVMNDIRGSKSEYANSTTISAQVQTISESVTKYTVIFEANGEQGQAVYLYDTPSKAITPVFVAPVPSNIQPVYIKQQSTPQGTTVLSTNNISYISSSQPDFKNVQSLITNLIGTPVTNSNANVQLTTQSSINTYKITITTETSTQIITINSDQQTNTQTLISYAEKPTEITPVQAQYTPVHATTDEKVQYLNWLKNANHSDIKNVINIVSIQTTTNALYSEAILEVETEDSSNIFVKTVKTAGAEVPTVVDVNSPHPQLQQSAQLGGGEIGQMQTTSKSTDSNGNTVTQSSDASQIEGNTAIQTVYTSILQTYTEYITYTVKFFKTVKRGKSTQVILALQGVSSQDSPIQVAAFFDEATKGVKLVSLQQIPADIAISSTPYPVPIVSTVNVPQNMIANASKSDQGLQKVISQITSSSELKNATIISAEIYTYDEIITQYNIVVDVKGQKQELVKILNKTSNILTPIITSLIPSEIVPLVYSEAKVDDQNVIISNKIESIKETYPQTTSAVDLFISENPTLTPVSIQSYIVSPSSETTTISIISKNQQGTRYIFNKYVTDESKEAIKVDSHSIPTIDVIKPKPIISTPIPTDDLLDNTAVTSSITKIINEDATKSLDTSKIISVEKSQKTTIESYRILTTDSTNQTVNIEVNYNPVTKQATVIDISKPITSPLLTETTVQDFTGKSQIQTNNAATIKQSKEFKKITDFIAKNHPNDAELISTPIVETTEKYQRSSIKTIAFSQENRTVQGTYLIDQRTNSTVELSYNVVPADQAVTTSLPITTPVTVSTTPEDISKSLESTALVSSLSVIQKVDFSLTNSTPIFIQVKNYTSALTITLVYDTPSSNSRVLVFFNSVTNQAKVVDYTKVPKVIESSRTVEKVNELGQVNLFTTNTKTITMTEQFKTVFTAVTKIVPALTNKAIKGVETTAKQAGKQYTIITVDNGIVTQVILYIDSATGIVTFLSHNDSPLANEILTILPKPQEKSKLTLQDMQSTTISEIGNIINQEKTLNLGPSIIISGTVTSNPFVQTYQLIVQTENNTKKQVTITKDLKSKDIMVNNVQEGPKKPKVQVKTSTNTNPYGQIEIITNSYQQITTTEETSTVIKSIKMKKPQFIQAKPISSKSITYGNTIQTTIIFTDEKQITKTPVQITTILNKKTGQVEIIDIKQIQIKDTYPSAPVTRIQSIPAPAVKDAAKKSPEINQIITLVQSVTTSTTQVQSLTVQDFGNVKKYIAVVPTPAGKQQLIYFFDKDSKKIRPVDSQTVPVLTAPQSYSQTTNQYGETVTSSSNIDKIAANIPEVTQAITQLTTIYSSSITKLIKLVTSKGTTIKEIKIVTVESQQEVTYTVLVDADTNTTQIIDVSCPKGKGSDEAKQGDIESQGGQIGVRVTNDEQKQIQVAIANSTEVSSQFTNTKIISITSTSTAFTDTYIATITDSHKNQANVTLIKNPGQPIKVINVQSPPANQTIQNADISTQTTTSAVTGQVKTTTNDQTAIQQDQTIQSITNNLIKIQPNLTDYRPVSTQTISYGEIVQTTLALISAGETSVQAITFYNTTDRTVQVVKIKKIDKPNDELANPTVSQQTIPAQAIPVAAQKYPQIQQIITTIQTTTTTQIETLTVQDYGTVLKYIAIATTPSGKQQSIFLYDKDSQKLKNIFSQPLPDQPAVNIQEKTSKWGEKIITSDSVKYVTEKYPETQFAINAIDTFFTPAVKYIPQSIQITQQNAEVEYKIVVKVDNSNQEITVAKEENVFKIKNVQSVPTVAQGQTSPQINQDVVAPVPIEATSTIGQQITQLVHIQLANSRVISINATDSLISTIFTVQVKDAANKVNVIQVLSQPGQDLSLLSTNEVQQSTAPSAEESSTTKEVSQITGQTVTTTTDASVIQNAENKPFISQIGKKIPQLQDVVPTTVKTTSYGNIVEKTFVIEQENTTHQVTTLLNQSSSVITVIDQRQTPSTQSTQVTQPISSVSVIPAPLITASATQIPQIKQILTEITTAKKEATLQSISIEDYGTVKKYIAVVPNPNNRQELVYLSSPDDQPLTLIANFTIPAKVEALIYEESTNKYGEKTIQSNNVTEVTTSIPQVSDGLGYISSKYPSITPEKIDFIKAVEYPNFLQTTITADSGSSDSLTIVLNIDKHTRAVTEVTTYSESDVPAVSAPSKDEESSVPMVPTDPVINKVVKFIEASKDVPVNDVQTVTQASSITTVFGNTVVTLVAVTSDQTKIEVVASYNPSTQQTTLNNFEILQSSPSSNDAITEFKVDALTGTKTTTTNDIAIISSSAITTSLLDQLKLTKSDLPSQTLISSTTVQYPDKVKVTSVFSPQPTAENVTQVTSVYDKSTATIIIIQTQETTLQAIKDTTSNRQIYTASEIQSAQSKIPAIPATTAFIHQQLPVYVKQNPTSVIVEPTEQTDFVSYIYDSATATTQVVVMYNKTSGESTLLESNPIPQDIQPFFYQEKKNPQGESVVTSNNITEVVQRVPKTELLQDYLSDKLQVNASDIKTVQSTIGSQYNYYTVVVDHDQGLRQYEFLVNTKNDEVKQVQDKKLPDINNVLLPQPKNTISVSPQSPEIQPLLNNIISDSFSNLTNTHSILTISKSNNSNVDSYDIQFVDSANKVKKLIVNQQVAGKPIFVDELPIDSTFVSQPPVIVSEKIDPVTKSTETNYPTAEIFQVDKNAEQVIQYASKNIPQVDNYTIQSARKSVYGQIQQYDILYKSPDKAPIQISIANDNNNKNMLLLENKKITEPEQINVLDSSVNKSKQVEVSDIEKENIKVLSKLGLVKDVKEYSEVPLTTIDQNQQFLTATEAVKQTYSVLLKESVIIKILEKKSLESDSLKVFFKAKDQIYQASIEMNPITQESKLTDFIKIGTQTSSKSEVNVYADLCYGYQIIEDVTIDSNIDFLLDYLRKKYDSLRDASLTEAQSIVLESGRINYKLYFKKDTQTIKYIVYYEPEYKRVLEVKGTSFLIGDKFNFVPKEQQVIDPYFRKLDTYIRQNRDQLNSATVLHTESKDDGQSIQFRTVYNFAGKTYRSIATIDKNNQNINENELNEIIEVPTEGGPTDIGQDQEALAVTKLDIHDLGKNLYFTEAHRFIQSKYLTQLDKGQLLGASGKSNLFSYIFKEFYMVDDQIVTVSAQYNPVTQLATVVSDPEIIDIQSGYFPVQSDKKLTEVRNWLKEKNLDLSSAVMISSESKQILFGSAYKIVFKDMTKYYTYVVYYDSTTREMRTLFENDSSTLQSAKPTTAQPAKSAQVIEPKLKGFARPQTSASS